MSRCTRGRWENTNRRRNAPTEAAAKPRTRYSSFTADHGQAARPGRRVGGETGEPAARSAQRISTGSASSTATNTEGDHAAGAYPPGHRPRRSDPRPAARSAPAARRLLDVDHGDRRRSVAAACPIFYWHITPTRGHIERGIKQDNQNERIRTAPAQRQLVKLIAFPALYPLDFP